MELGLQINIFHILREVCGSQIILPRSFILSDNVTKEGDVPFDRQGFADVWKGHYNGNRVCIRVFRVSTAEDLSKIKQVYTLGSRAACNHLTACGSTCSRKS